MAGLPKFDSLEQQVFLELWRSYDRLKAEEEKTFDRFEISSQQYNALRLLHAAEPESLRVSELGQRMVTRAPDMTRMLDKLESRGWIKRIRRDENRRAIEVSLTTKGRQLLERMSQPVLDCSKRQLGHLSRGRLQELISLLREVRQPHEIAETNTKDLQSVGVDHDHAN